MNNEPKLSKSQIYIYIYIFHQIAQTFTYYTVSYYKLSRLKGKKEERSKNKTLYTWLATMAKSVKTFTWKLMEIFEIVKQQPKLFNSTRL